MANLLMPVVVAMLACAIGSSDRDWGFLRYLYIAPVSRSRLLLGKLGAVLIATAATTSCVVAAGLVAGLAWFGRHPFHIIGSPVLSTGDAAGRLIAACGYITLCLLSIAAIAFALALLLPRGAKAVGASIAFVIAANILDGQSALHSIAVLLPVHYWQDWTRLFAAKEPAHLGTGSWRRSPPSRWPPGPPPSSCGAAIQQRDRARRWARPVPALPDGHGTPARERRAARRWATCSSRTARSGASMSRAPWGAEGQGTRAHQRPVALPYQVMTRGRRGA
ncbi:hypothetical protein GCM10023178_26850 [Actinomadura luteofluorescens]